MKLHLPILWMLAAAGPALAQSPVQEVIDNTLIQNVNTNTQNILSMLQQQLDEAKKQSENLNDQLTRMGDPSAITLPALELIKQDIAYSVQMASNGTTREQRLRSTTGEEAFGDHTFGLMSAVNPTVTFKDGETGERDPSLYKLQGALAGDLTAYTEMAQDVDERTVALQQQRLALFDQISTATDLASVIKLQTAISAIDAQIANANANLSRAKLDYDVLKEQTTLQAQIDSRARSEAKTMERTHIREKAKAKSASGGSTAGGSSSGGSTGGASGSSGTKPFSNLGWGSK